MTEAPIHVAIIGGGITGAVVARELLRLCGKQLRVTVFDQGRGLGGRTAHRRIREDGEYLSSEDAEAAFAFDHGCQFFRADSECFQQELLHEWIQKGWVAEWSGSFAGLKRLPVEEGDIEPDFYGFPGKPPFYCGVGGMSSLASALLEDAATVSGADIRGSVRVAGVTPLPTNGWLLSGTSGKAALHDTAEIEAARVSPDALGEFDIVVVTDVSASMAGWHRASAGIPESVASRVRGRTRVAMFTALFAFEEPLAVKEDAFSASDDTLWFAARTRSKPGLHGACKFDCWTLLCTPKYASVEIDRVPMQDPKTGAFRPQEMSYLREGPCAVLLEAFERLLASNGYEHCLPLPKIAYVGGQRWGSAFPAPVYSGGRDGMGRGSSTVEVQKVAYESSSHLALAPESTGTANAATTGSARNFLAEDSQRIYYAGDYLSLRLPGMEAAALSGLDVARHIASVISSKV